MLSLTSVIFVSALLLSNVITAQQASLQNNDAALEAMRHQQAVVKWLSRCVIAAQSARALDDDCKDSPNGSPNVNWRRIDWNLAQQIDYTNLLARGVQGISPRWSSFWLPRTDQHRGIYFYPQDTGVLNRDGLKYVQASSINSMFSGTVIKLNTSWGIDSGQPISLSLPTGAVPSVSGSPPETTGLPLNAYVVGIPILISKIPVP